MSETFESKATAAAAWEKYLRQAKIRLAELDSCKSARAKAIRIGQFFGPLVDQVVPIEVGGRTGKARLKMVKGRGNERRYGFIIHWDQPAADDPKKDAHTAQVNTMVDDFGVGMATDAVAGPSFNPDNIGTDSTKDSTSVANAAPSIVSNGRRNSEKW
jgi:hypothetical protein